LSRGSTVVKLPRVRRRPQREITAVAPAKVNLTLRVLGRREDGYHELESLMVPISITDELRVRVAAGRPVVTCRVTGPERVAGGGSNLAARAARSVLQELGLSARVSIALRKVIPVGAGLGGGSSDAATVLKVLPGLLGRRLSRGRALALAAALGADVPFFLACRPTLATGIGEILAPIAGFPRRWMVVAVPPQRIDTAWAYAHALPKRAKRRVRAVSGPKSSRGGGNRLPLSGETLSFRLSNDFERLVGAACPAVPRLSRTLRELGAVATVMSGSGSAVVGLFESAAGARSAAAAIRPPDKAFAVRVLRRAPQLVL